jgi:hypothetical protein
MLTKPCVGMVFVYKRILFLKVSQFQNVLLVSSNLPKNQRIFFKDFCPSLWKEVKSGWFYFDSLTLLFWFNIFLEARAEILKKLLVFWEIWRHQKDILKLTYLYALSVVFNLHEKNECCVYVDTSHFLQT